MVRTIFDISIKCRQDCVAIVLHSIFVKLAPAWQGDDGVQINLAIAGKNDGPSADCNYLWQSALLLGGVTVSIRLKARVTAARMVYYFETFPDKRPIFEVDRAVG